MSTLKGLLSVWWEAILTISVVITFSILGIDELDTARTRQVRRKMQKCLNVTSVKVQTEDQIQMHSMQLHSKAKISFECAYSNAHTWVKYTWLVCAACSVCSQISCGMCDSVTISPVLHVCCGCGCSSCAFWNYNLILHVCHIPGNSEYDLCGALHSSWSSSLLVLVCHILHTLLVCFGCGCSACVSWNSNSLVLVCHISGNSDCDLCGLLHGSWNSTSFVLVCHIPGNSDCDLYCLLHSSCNWRWLVQNLTFLASSLSLLTFITYNFMCVLKFFLTRIFYL